MNVAEVCRDQLFALFFLLKRSGWVGFCSIFHDIALKLRKILLFDRERRLPNQLQNVVSIQMSAF